MARPARTCRFARLLAAADAYHAMTEPRAHRAPLAPERRRPSLGETAGTGSLDADAVTAVVEAAGQTAPRIERPAGLTEREVEVVRLLARGLQTKQVAGALGISVKTADHHIQNAYRKLGVSSRAATLVAMEHGLMAWENSRWPARRLVVASSSTAQRRRTRWPSISSDRRSTRSPRRSRRPGAPPREVEAVMTPVRDWMLRELSPRAGDTVLELAAGVGDTGFDTAMVVGEQGRVICSDFSAMLDAARRRGAERGLENVDYRVIDAEQIQLETDSVDGVLCRLGYMLMADRAQALAETRRVRPGGRLALAVWGRWSRTRSSRSSRSPSPSTATCRRPSRLVPVFSMAVRIAPRRCWSARASPACGPRRWRCGSRCRTRTGI